MGQDGDHEARLEARSLTKRFGTRRVLDNVSLNVRPAEIVTVLGSKGAGKRTLVQVLGGEAAPDEGQILCRGTDVTRHSAKQRLACGIGLADQQHSSGRGLWNILRPPGARTVRDELIYHLKGQPFSRALGRKRTRYEMSIWRPSIVTTVRRAIKTGGRPESQVHPAGFGFLFVGGWMAWPVSTKEVWLGVGSDGCVNATACA